MAFLLVFKNEPGGVELIEKKRRKRFPESVSSYARWSARPPPGVPLVLLLLSPAVISVGSQSPPDVPDQADGFSDDDDCSGFAGRDTESVAPSEHECDEDDASAAPAPGPAASRRPKRRTRYCTAQKEFNNACRRKSDAGGSVFKSVTAQGWVVQPTEASMQAVAPGSRLDPSAYWVKPWGGWVPEQLFPRLCTAPPCPICIDGGTVNAAAAKWQKRFPRTVLSTRQRGGFFFLDAKAYRCGSCGSPFLGSHPDSVAKLPTKVKLEFTLPSHYHYITITLPLHHRYITIILPLHYR